MTNREQYDADLNKLQKDYNIDISGRAYSVIELEAKKAIFDAREKQLWRKYLMFEYQGTGLKIS